MIAKDDTLYGINNAATQHRRIYNPTKGLRKINRQTKIALEPDAHDFLNPDEFKTLMAQYEHPLWKFIGETAREVDLHGGHDGMDYMMDWRLIYCLRNGLPLDQDVYDAAAWSSILPLSEWSVNNRSNSVDVPDFTAGAWKTNPLNMDINLEKCGNTRIFQ